MKMFRIVFVGVVAVFSLQVVFAQDLEKWDRVIPYDLVTIKPLFPDRGEIGFSEWIIRNTRYHQSAVENGIQGVVHVRYIVERDGSIVDVQVVNDADSLLSREVVRVISILPRFIPGRQKIRYSYLGLETEYVRVLMEAKIHFVLLESHCLKYADSIRFANISDNVDINITIFGYPLPRRMAVISSRPTFWQRITRIFR